MSDVCTVLLVEDEQDLRWNWTDFLVKHSIKVIGARNGVEGLRLYARYAAQISLIIADCQMPIMDGETMVRRIQGMNPKVKVLAVGQEWPGDIDCLAKPLNLDELLQKVTFHLS